MNELFSPIVRLWTYVGHTGGFPGQIFFCATVVLLSRCLVSFTSPYPTLAAATLNGSETFRTELTGTQKFMPKISRNVDRT